MNKELNKHHYDAMCDLTIAVQCNSIFEAKELILFLEKYSNNKSFANYFGLYDPELKISLEDYCNNYFELREEFNVYTITKDNCWQLDSYRVINTVSDNYTIFSFNEFKEMHQQNLRQLSNIDNSKKAKMKYRIMIQQRTIPFNTGEVEYNNIQIGRYSSLYCLPKNKLELLQKTNIYTTCEYNYIKFKEIETMTNLVQLSNYTLENKSYDVFKADYKEDEDVIELYINHCVDYFVEPFGFDEEDKERYDKLSKARKEFMDELNLEIEKIEYHNNIIRNSFFGFFKQHQLKKFDSNDYANCNKFIDDKDRIIFTP